MPAISKAQFAKYQMAGIEPKTCVVGGCDNDVTSNYHGDRVAAAIGMCNDCVDHNAKAIGDPMWHIKSVGKR